MGYEYYAAFLTTDELEKGVAELHIKLSDFPEREESSDDLPNLFDLFSEDNFFSDREAMASLEIFSNDYREEAIPEGVREKVKTFLGAFPPLVFWEINSFQNPSIAGREFPMEYELREDMSHWFLSETEVVQLKELADFIPALEDHYKILKEELAKLGPPPEPIPKPAPTGFFARLFWKPELPPMKRSLDTQEENLYYLLDLLKILVSLLDRAIDKKTGLLVCGFW